MKNLDDKTIWFALGIISLVILSFFAYRFIGFIMLTLFIYYSTLPIFNKMGKYVNNKNIRAFLSILTFFIPFSLILIYSIFILIRDLYKFFTELEARDYLPDWFINNYINSYENIFNNVLSGNNISQAQVREIFELSVSALGSISKTFRLLIYLLLIIISVFYLLRDGLQMKKWVFNKIGVNNKLKKFLFSVDKDLRSIYFGNTLTIFIVAFISSAFFLIYNFISPTALHIPYPVLLGFLCGFSSIFPMFGIKIVYIPAFLYFTIISFFIGLGNLFWLPMIVGLIIGGIVIDLIPETYIRPYVSNREMHLGFVIVAYITGVLAFGWYGLFFGPFLLSITYQFFRIYFK